MRPVRSKANSRLSYHSVAQPIYRLQVDTDIAKQTSGHLQTDPAPEAEELQTAANVAGTNGEQWDRRE